MKNIILGNGVAARIMSHLLAVNTIVLCERPHNKSVNNLSGGVRYLDVPTETQLNYARLLGERKFSEIEGGVIVDTHLYPWNEIFSNVAYKHYITGRYAIEQGRDWSPNIMNKMFIRTEPPRYISDLSYAELLSRFESTNEILQTDQIVNINIENQCIYYHKDNELQRIYYDNLINTLPIEVFDRLSKRDRAYNIRNTYNIELSQKTDYHKDMM